MVADFYLLLLFVVLFIFSIIGSDCLFLFPKMTLRTDHLQVVAVNLLPPSLSGRCPAGTVRKQVDESISLMLREDTGTG